LLSNTIFADVFADQKKHEKAGQEMSSFHHDPLPWQACCRGRKLAIVSVCPHGSDEVAQVYLNNYKGKTVTRARRGNAKLMLVACNTHQALRDVLSEINERIESGDSAFKGSDVHQKIKNALAKVVDEEQKAEKAVTPEGAPCSTFWNSLLAYATPANPANPASTS
jgi:CRISPR/Cas system-associated exonuclease Cas4 (RecB family)